jgi:hypothetical protein
MSDGITLSEQEIQALTGYERPTKQLAVLRSRGFVRAYIGRNGVVLERAHYEAVSRGELHHSDQIRGSGKVANLSFLKQRA